jgi:hypothetical protein
MAALHQATQPSVPISTREPVNLTVMIGQAVEGITRTCETAHGDYLELVASAGRAFDMVHPNYQAQRKLRIVRTQKSGPDGVEWRVERKRPILPASEPAVPVPDQK